MKTAKLLLLVLAAGLIPATSEAQDISGTTAYWTEVQLLTRAAPTLVTEGLNLRGVIGFRVTVCANATRTLSGTGTLQAYVWDNDLLRWIRNPALDISVSTSGVRCLAFPDIRTAAASGRVLFAANAVTVSAGTTVDVQIKASVAR